MTFDSENAVAEELGVVSLRDLGEEERVKLAAMLPDISEPLRSRLYEIVPKFEATAIAAINAYEQTYIGGLDSNDKNQQRIHEGLKQSRAIIAGKLARDGLSEEYEQYLVESLKEADRLEAEKDTENKAFISHEARKTRKDAMFIAIGVPVITILVSVGAQALLGRTVPPASN